MTFSNVFFVIMFLPKEISEFLPEHKPTALYLCHLHSKLETYPIEEITKLC